MSWVWWLLIAIGVVVFFTMRRGEKQPQLSAREQLLGPYARQRDMVDSELNKVVELIANLSVVASAGEHDGVLSRADLAPAVSNFMKSAGIIGAQTSTKMLHVVTSPSRVVVVLKLKPARPEAAVREYTRIGQDAWVHLTRSSSNMDTAIQEAEARS